MDYLFLPAVAQEVSACVGELAPAAASLEMDLPGSSCQIDSNPRHPVSHSSNTHVQHLCHHFDSAELQFTYMHNILKDVDAIHNSYKN